LPITDDIRAMMEVGQDDGEDVGDVHTGTDDQEEDERSVRDHV
jgi:hypothetical protein